MIIYARVEYELWFRVGIWLGLSFIMVGPIFLSLFWIWLGLWRFYGYGYGYGGYGFGHYGEYNGFGRRGSYGYHQNGRAPLSGYNSAYSSNRIGSSGPSIAKSAISSTTGLNSKSMVNIPDKTASGIINTNEKASINTANVHANSTIKLAKPGSINNSNPQNNIAQNQKSRQSSVVSRQSKSSTVQQSNKAGMNSRYNKPAQKFAKPKTYTSPGYSQAKSGQYYSRPNAYGRSNSNRQFAIPRNNGSGRSEYSMPRGGSSQGVMRSYSVPSRSFSASSGGGRGIISSGGGGHSNGGGGSHSGGGSHGK